MIKRCVALLSITILAISLRTDALAQNAINATGNWSMTPTGEAFANGQVKMRQDGSGVVGTYSPNGHFEGKFQPGTLQVDASWNDSRGSGWMTIVFAANGRNFSGQWGRPGSSPIGHFEAVRFAYPNVSGLFYVNVTGGTEMTARRISLHQLGLDVVGNLGPGTQLDGTIDSDTNTLTGSWKEPNGSGWIKLKFADDGKSFAGTWGLAAGAEAAGEINGGVVDTSLLHVNGLWEIASSGGAFYGNVLKLTQQGETITGSFKDGRLQGTLTRGSASLSGTWRDAHGTGVVALKFTSNAMHFQGTWTRKGGSSGSIIGKRVIAATPALRN